MDVQKLANLKHWLEYSSFTLSLETYVLLTNSLLLLQNENHFKKLFFWGIVQGIEGDYYISFGYEKDALTERKYYYSEDCQNWKLLPVPQREHLALTELCKRPFQGDPGFVIEVVDDAPPDDLFPDDILSMQDEAAPPTTFMTETEGEGSGKGEGDGQSEGKEKEQVDEEASEKASENKSKISGGNDTKKSELTVVTGGELKEEDRLAAITKIISDEAGLVPRGGLFKLTDGSSVHSRAFEGVKLEDADSLCNFVHYRVPWNDWNTNLLIRCDYNYAVDFLDTIDKDIPEDCWSAYLVEGDRTVILRNLYWPGFMFFHYLDSPDHGFVYIGQGLRNIDIPFMTQVMLPLPPVEEGDPLSVAEEGSKITKLSEGSVSNEIITKLDSKLESRQGTRVSSRGESRSGTKTSESRAGTRTESRAGTRTESRAGTKTDTIAEET